METVHQAHLLGNYELYDPDSSRPGAAVCKKCWEDSGQVNAGSLNTVWVSTREGDMMWWLCLAHAEGTKSGKEGPIIFVRSVQGAVRYPGPQAA